MNSLELIAARRSIRKFKSDPIPEEVLQTILLAGSQAPSGKNSQPWHFVVVKGDQRAEMVRVMRTGIARMKTTIGDIGSSEGTANIMEQAPVTVFIFNPKGLHPSAPRDIYSTVSEIVDTQSIGAAIQNMLLAAAHLGIGSLWIADTVYAYDELCAWLGQKGQMVAAVSLGYADEAPPARFRKPLAQLVTVKGS